MNLLVRDYILINNKLLVRIRLIKASYAYNTDLIILLSRFTYYNKDKCLEWSYNKRIILIRPAKQAIAPYSLFLKDYATSLA
jgi:hypothetical protein